MDWNTILDPATRPKRCIVIAFDGARADYLEKFNTPTMHALVQRGVGFRNAIASNGIAETAPGFASIATGGTAKEHGVISSGDWYDRETGETLYIYDGDTNNLRLLMPQVAQRLKAQYPHLKVASISTKDRLAVMLAGPDADVVAYSYREHVFHRQMREAYTGSGVGNESYMWTERKGHELPSYLKELSVPRRVDWSGPGFHHPDQDTADTAEIDTFIAEGALAILEQEKPDLLFIGLVSTNIVGHAYGPDSQEIKATIEAADALLGRLVKQLESSGLLEETLFIVTSDHGMGSKWQGVDVTTLLKERYGPSIADNILHTFAGTAGGLYLKDTSPRAIQEAVTAVRSLPHVKGAWWKHDPDAPWFIQRISHERCPDIVVIPDSDSVMFDVGMTSPSFPYGHGAPFPADVSIIQIFSGPGIRRLGFIGEPFDLNSTELLTEEQIDGVPEHRHVATLMEKVLGIS